MPPGGSPAASRRNRTARDVERAFYTTSSCGICGKASLDAVVIGWALREDRLPLRDCVLQVSGRASFEPTQKALMAGIATLAAVSAPSSLAVDLAAEAGMTLIGFVPNSSMNICTRSDRITTD